MKGWIWCIGFLMFWGGVQDICAERPRYVTILQYQWYDDPWMGKTGTPLETFREQMDYLEKEGYQVVPLSVLRRMYEGGEPLLEKMVAITIEGSDRLIYDTVYPLLKTKGYPSVLFPCIQALDSALPNGLTWQMVETLYQAGVDVGTLPYRNSHLGMPESGQNKLDYRLQVRSEMLHAQRALQLHHIETDLLAFAHGEYNVEMIQEAKTLGYAWMFTRDKGALDARTMPTLIPRIPVVTAMDEQRFVFNLNLAPLHVVDVRPEFGFVDVNPPNVFSMRLVTPQDYRPGVVNMFVSEWGNVGAEFNAATGVLTFRPTQTLRNAQNRVIVTAKERESDHFAIFSRLYLHPFKTLSRP